MTYLVLNHTNYGDGIYIVGHFKSRKRAEKLVKSLEKPTDQESGNSWTVREIMALDKYTDESVIDYAKGLDR